MMVNMSSAALAEIIKGDFIRGLGSEFFSGVTIDSREETRGRLFIALKGEKYQGAEFVEQAINKGASGALIPREAEGLVKFKVKPNDECFLIKTDDTLLALQNLARYYRRRAGLKVVGVTGSTGKTTTKDYIKSVLSQKFKAAAAPGNFNNEIGLPLSILNFPDLSEVLVLELAMRALGEIEELAAIAKPEVGVVTSIGLTHYERLGNQERIAQAKAELLKSLPSDGFAVIPADSQFSDYLESMTLAKVFKFGLNSQKAFIRAEQIKLDSLARPEFTLIYGRERIKVRLKQSGQHFIMNALAAATVGFIFGLTAKEVKNGLEQAELSLMRGEIENYRGIWLINDAYNANPDSMDSALKILNHIRAKRKVACLGDMLELGSISEAQHRLLAKKICSFSVDMLVLVGEEVKWTREELKKLGYKNELRVFKNAEEAGLFLASKVVSGDAILFKASRLIEMEKALQTLKEKLKDV